MGLEEAQAVLAVLVALSGPRKRAAAAALAELLALRGIERAGFAGRATDLTSWIDGNRRDWIIGR